MNQKEKLLHNIGRRDEINRLRRQMIIQFNYLMDKEFNFNETKIF